MFSLRNCVNCFTPIINDMHGIYCPSCFTGTFTKTKSNEAVILIGPPGCGKSSFLEKNIETYREYEIISFDEILKFYQNIYDIPYNQCYQLFGKDCYKEMDKEIELCIERHSNFVLDFTNLTTISRKRNIEKMKLAKYRITGIYFKWYHQMLVDRVAKREQETGKYIPENVLEYMIKAYEIPSVEEGFDELIPA